MIKAKRLKAEWPERSKTPQCSAPVNRDWYDRTDYYSSLKNKLEKQGHSIACCTRQSVVEIDGKPYCALHGGAVALKILLDNQQESKPSPQPLLHPMDLLPLKDPKFEFIGWSWGMKGNQVPCHWTIERFVRVLEDRTHPLHLTATMTQGWSNIPDKEENNAS